MILYLRHQLFLFVVFFNSFYEKYKKKISTLNPGRSRPRRPHPIRKTATGRDCRRSAPFFRAQNNVQKRFGNLRKRRNFPLQWDGKRS